MTHVATLIGARGSRALDDALIARAAQLLPAAGTPRWLAPADACDLAFSPASRSDLKNVERHLRESLAPAAVDVVVQPAANRRKRLLVADMDSTIIEQECIDEIADFAGIKARIAAITERAMRGELVFEDALKERVYLLAGLDAGVLERVLAERVTLMPGARALTATMRANGGRCVLVSGGFTFFTRRIAERAGFDADQANVIEIDRGKLTGRVAEPILGRDAKLQALRRHRSALGLAQAETLAVGDGANDLDMIAEAGLGVAYRAKPVVAVKAPARIEHGDLTALLYLQGYSQTDFVAAG